MFEILSSSAQAQLALFSSDSTTSLPPHPPGIFFSESVFLKLRLQPKRDWVFYLMKTTTNWSDLTNHPPLQPPAPPIRLGKFLFLKVRLQSRKGGVLPAQAKLTVFSNSRADLPHQPPPPAGKVVFRAAADLVNIFKQSKQPQHKQMGSSGLSLTQLSFSLFLLYFFEFPWIIQQLKQEDMFDWCSSFMTALPDW